MKIFQLIITAMLAILLAITSVAQLCHGSFIGFIAFGAIFILAVGGVFMAVAELKEEHR